MIISLIDERLCESVLDKGSETARYGWAVCAASGYVMFVGVGTLMCYGVLYVEFLDYFGEGRTKTSWIGALCWLSLAVAGKSWIAYTPLAVVSRARKVSLCNHCSKWHKIGCFVERGHCDQHTKISSGSSLTSDTGINDISIKLKQ
jgi:hypothetical protein